MKKRLGLDALLSIALGALAIDQASVQSLGASTVAAALFALLLAGPADARPGPYGALAVATTRLEAGAPCEGGNIAGLLGMQKLPGGAVVSSGMDLQKIEPGTYFVYYEHSRFKTVGGDCNEFFPPPIAEGAWGDAPKVQVTIAPGKVVRLSLDRALVPQVEVLDELPITAEMVGRIAMAVSGLQRWTRMCGELFPQAEAGPRGGLASTSVPAYAKLFGMAEQQVPAGPKTTLELLGQTQQQSARWCAIDLPREVERFDYSFADRISEVRNFLSSGASSAGHDRQTP